MIILALDMDEQFILLDYLILYTVSTYLANEQTFQEEVANTVYIT